MSAKSQEDYLKEIANKINDGKEYKIDNPTLKDIKSLKDHDYIITEGKHFPVIIRKRYVLETVLNIPVLMDCGGYEIGDNVMGIIPENLTAEEILEELKGYRGEV